MHPLKNLAGNEASLFLFRFELRGNSIDFVVNQGIAADMYPDVDEQLKPLAHVCCETLLRYRHLSVSPTIMDGHIVATGAFEVMLSKGLGRHVMETEKQQLFQDAKHIADLLVEVMDRKTHELQGGTPHRASHTRSSQPLKSVTQGLEALGEAKRRHAERQWLAEGNRVRPGVQQLRPQDLPPGVTAARGYDHRGHCLTFTHTTLGALGKIVLIPMPQGGVVLQAEFSTGDDAGASSLVQQKKQLFEHVVATVNSGFDDNVPA